MAWYERLHFVQSNNHFKQHKYPNIQVGLLYDKK